MEQQQRKLRPWVKVFLGVSALALVMTVVDIEEFRRNVLHVIFVPLNDTLPAISSSASGSESDTPSGSVTCAPSTSASVSTSVSPTPSSNPFLGTWIARNDSYPTYEFVPLSRPAHRVTHDEAMKCLKGKSLAFIGDSTTRFNYVSLIYFLHFGQWFSRYSIGAPGDIAVVHGFGGDYGGWRQHSLFYNKTSLIFDGWDTCMCQEALSNHPKDFIEYRFYRHPTGDFQITYIWIPVLNQNFSGWLPLGHDPSRNVHTHDLDTLMNLTWSRAPWDVVDLMDEAVKFDTLFFQFGVWGEPPEGTKYRMFQTIADIARRRGGRAVWRGTRRYPAIEIPWEWIRKDMDVALAMGLEIFDEKGMFSSAPKSVLVDHIHLQTWGNEELNNELLRLTCNL